MMEPYLKNKPQKYLKLFFYYKEKCEQFRMLEELGQNSCGTFSVPGKSITSNPTRLYKLKLMKIEELKLQKVQRGCYLQLKIILPCFKMNAISALCEDHTGQDCIQLSIYNFNLKGQHYDKYFPVNTVFYLKEPFFKTSATGTHIIRIDDPKDILFENHPEVKELNLSGQGLTGKGKQIKEAEKEEEYRAEGVDLMERKEYVDAYLLYSRAIEQTKDSGYKIKFLLNKAIVCFKLNLINEYGDILEEVLKLDPNNKKAIYHKIKQLILQEHYDDAHNLLKERGALIDKETEKDIMRFLKIQRSFKENKINWYRAIKFQELGQYFSDKIEVGKSPFGLGIIAKTKISPGDILIVERPLLCMEIQTQSNENIFHFMSNSSNDNKMKMNMEKLYLNSKEFRQKASKLASSEQLLEQKRAKQSQRSIQRLNDLIGVLETNWFELTQLNNFFQLKIPCKSTGLYEKACMLNHCCQFNCERFNIGTTMIVYAVQEVQPGQELFITYKKETDYYQRKRSLLFWNIKCKCVFCTEQLSELNHGERKTNGKSMELKRLKMLENFRRFRDKSPEINNLLLYYDIQSIVLMICVGHDFERAGKMFRRIFPMSQTESQNIISEFMMIQ